MHRNPAEFSKLLDAAALKIEQTDIHPGQAMPGVWRVGGPDSPERLIGMVAADALHRVCQERQLPFEKVLASYAIASKNISIRPKGGPDVMAIRHLRDAAEELRRQARMKV